MEMAYLFRWNRPNVINVAKNHFSATCLKTWLRIQRDVLGSFFSKSKETSKLIQGRTGHKKTRVNTERMLCTGKPVEDKVLYPPIPPGLR